MEQIVKKGYADRYGKDTVLLALAIDNERRTIAEYQVKNF
jgi:hypothetical protein